MRTNSDPAQVGGSSNQPDAALAETALAAVVGGADSPLVLGTEPAMAMGNVYSMIDLSLSLDPAAATQNPAATNGIE
jgi:hypothetical protein